MYLMSKGRALANDEIEDDPAVLDDTEDNP
jgi:hypothetical protein